MTEYITVGPFEKPPRYGYSEGYSNSRTARDIEQEIGRYGYQFTFHDELQALAQRFPGEPLSLFEGGCGHGGILKQLSTDARLLRLGVSTTGADKNLSLYSGAAHIEGLDTLILGSVQSAHAQGLLVPNSTHMIVDIRGALFYDTSRGRNNPVGGTVLPIYAQILKGGGAALLFEWGFQPESGWNGSLETGKIKEKQLLDLIARNNLNVAARMGPYALLRK